MKRRFASVVVAGIVLGNACSSESNDGGANAPTTTTEAGTTPGDAAGPPGDSGAPDAPVLPPGPCDPQEVPPFTPAWKPPTPLHQNRCTPAQVDTIMHCSFDPTASVTACNDFNSDQANDDCTACLFTVGSASVRAAFFIVLSVAYRNTGGCVANAQNDFSATGCGQKLQAADECADKACAHLSRPPCSEDGGVSAEAKSRACQEKARESVCGKFDVGPQCLDALKPGGVAAMCAEGNTLLEGSISIGNAFCGG